MFAAAQRANEVDPPANSLSLELQHQEHIHARRFRVCLPSRHGAGKVVPPVFHPIPSPGGHGSVVVRLLASHLGELGLIPGWVAPGFSQVGITPDDATGRRVFSGMSRFSRPCVPALLLSHLYRPRRLSRPRCQEQLESLRSLNFTNFLVLAPAVEAGDKILGERALQFSDWLLKALGTGLVSDWLPRVARCSLLAELKGWHTTTLLFLSTIRRRAHVRAPQIDDNDGLQMAEALGMTRRGYHPVVHEHKTTKRDRVARQLVFDHDCTLQARVVMPFVCSASERHAWCPKAPTKRIMSHSSTSRLVRLPAANQGELGSIPGRIDATSRRAFSGISRFPRSFIQVPLNSHLITPSSALKTSIIPGKKVISADRKENFANSTTCMLDSTVLCILESQMFVNWLLPQIVASVASHPAVRNSLHVYLQVSYWLGVVQGKVVKERFFDRPFYFDDCLRREWSRGRRLVRHAKDSSQRTAQFALLLGIRINFTALYAPQPAPNHRILNNTEVKESFISAIGYGASKSATCRDDVRQSAPATGNSVNQSHTRLVSRASRSQSENGWYAHIKGTAMSFRLCVHVYSVLLRSIPIYRGRDGSVVILLASHQGEPGPIPLGFQSDDAAIRWVFSGSPVYHRRFISALLHSRLASLSSVLTTSLLTMGLQRHDGNTVRLARRSDEALGVRVTVARIAPSLLDLGRACPSHSPNLSTQRSLLYTGMESVMSPKDYANFARLGIWDDGKWKRSDPPNLIGCSGEHRQFTSTLSTVLVNFPRPFNTIADSHQHVAQGSYIGPILYTDKAQCPMIFSLVRTRFARLYLVAEKTRPLGRCPSIESSARATMHNGG
ncbi:hypothetical protein PR048_031164 [Dryococelus australis]|uniref:Uncharacterized protein n=1 Tax=Dryococelus australis TaxID=614101 RepID=A0ABQ9G584_9NEOP|nr:hypothetical protein PR048_031164 [Dryococelus australis]